MFSSRKSAAPSGGYNLTKSLRFRRSASAYLNRTFSSPTSGTKWTISYWAKLGIIGRANHFAPNLSTNEGSISIESDFALYVNARVGTVGGAGTNYVLATTQVFRDPSAWYHIVVALDTTQATASNRVKVYVNGTQVTAFSTANYPPQNSTPIMGSAVSHAIGRVGESGYEYYYDGLFGEMNYVDGQALTPSSFGETSTTTGVWQPKKYSGSYGTNGFYLKFTDTTSTSTLGTDFSGNSNTWTVNNISLTAGSTYDSMNDVPTLTSATTANYAVLNPINLYTGCSCANGNLQGITVTGAECGIYGTLGVSSGKWYFESTPTAITLGGCMIGIAPATTQGSNGSPGLTVTAGYGYYTTGNSYHGSGVSYGNSFTTNDVIGVALDLDNGKIWWSKNGVFQASGNPAAGTNAAYTGVSGTFVPGIGNGGAGSSSTVECNFGQQPFVYTPPTGFLPLNTYNLPTPTIGATASTTANEYFDVTLYTGNGTSQSIINSGSMQPDLTWIKVRDTTSYHELTDSVRGTGKTLFSNATDAELTTNTMTAFNSNGFSVAVNGGYFGTNENGRAFVGWQWRASNATAVTNTNGSITSTVSASTTAGFSIVTYTGVGGSGTTTVGHGLNVSPSMVIIKRRNSTADWATYHTGLTSTSYYLFLNSTAGQANYGSTFISPSSSTLTIDAGSSLLNASGGTYVAYCFAPVAGYSAFGSYTGNGSTDGTFIFTGFRPRFVMVKRSSGIEAWTIRDTSRNTYNVANLELQANSSGAEGAAGGLDLLSNGFKCRAANNEINASGDTYIYMAFAENPFKYANAR
jgi:hypothetical protein